jgi:hypothetical protein
MRIGRNSRTYGSERRHPGKAGGSRCGGGKQMKLLKRKIFLDDGQLIVISASLAHINCLSYISYTMSSPFPKAPKGPPNILENEINST